MSGRGAPVALFGAMVAAGVMSPPQGVHPSQPDDPPHVVERGTPVLPDSLARLRLSGWAMVRVRFDSAGTVADARVLDPVVSGYFFGHHAAAFESAAVAAARACRVEPGAGQTSAAGATETLDLRLRPCADCELTRCFDIPRRGS